MTGERRGDIHIGRPLRDHHMLAEEAIELSDGLSQVSGPEEYADYIARVAVRSGAALRPLTATDQRRVAEMVVQAKKRGEPVELNHASFQAMRQVTGDELAKELISMKQGPIRPNVWARRVRSDKWAQKVSEIREWHSKEVSKLRSNEALELKPDGSVTVKYLSSVSCPQRQSEGMADSNPRDEGFSFIRRSW